VYFDKGNALNKQFTSVYTIENDHSKQLPTLGGPTFQPFNPHMLKH